MDETNLQSKSRCLIYRVGPQGRGKRELPVTVSDLTRIKDEFEQINQSYRKTFSMQARLDLIERVKTLLELIEHIKRVGQNNDVGE